MSCCFLFVSFARQWKRFSADNVSRHEKGKRCVWIELKSKVTLYDFLYAGQLSCLAVTDLYRHLSQEHDPTVIGILLGMSSAKR